MKLTLVPVLLALVSLVSICSAQEKIRGIVTDDDGNPLVGASVKYMHTDRTTLTDETGEFVLPRLGDADTLVISYLGYMPFRLPVATASNPLHIALFSDPNALEEVVVNTGYYEIPKERATGSFTYIDNKLLRRGVSTNILERLEGVVNGVQFVQPQATDASGIRVRGLSTIDADTRPLIVVDNFPYEGDINTINPNDVESITVLRDAAAASIWGARAGNGVIVINTRRGQYDQPVQISFNSNMNVIDKPDLFYSQRYLPSYKVMEIQKELFERGSYREQNQTYIPSYIELLIKKRDNLIGEAEFLRQEAFMQSTDLRKEKLKYLYQTAINQQYALGVRGGGDAYRYAFSMGYDKNRSNLVGNTNNRLNISLQNSFRIGRQLELTGTFWYTHQSARNNATSLTQDSEIYDALLDIAGNPASAANTYRALYRESAMESGLLDWSYRPLMEMRLADNTSGNREMRMNVGLRYSFLDNFNVQTTYQYTQGDDWSRQYYHPDSYYVRNLVNRFTQSDGTQVIPYGGVLEMGSPTDGFSHSARGQINYSRQFGVDHQVVALAGAELRARIVQMMPNLRIFNYDDDLGTGVTQLDYLTRWPTRPTGSNRIPLSNSTATSPSKHTNHDLSYFGNASYTYKERYVLSGSLRWDGSNLLGVKANQRGTALWSIGGSWQMSREAFFSIDWLTYLRLRSTYGSAGNIDKSQSHYPTISLGTNDITGLVQATLRHPGNPSLRWEQVNTANAGMDWRVYNNRIGGSIEYYDKHAKHLLGSNMMDPTTGAGDEYKTNYADLRTRGWDIQVDSRNLVGRFSWNTTLLLSSSKNKVTAFNGPEHDNVSYYFSRRIPETGRSLDMIYALPWHGLSGTDGMPIIYADGQQTTDASKYSAYYLNFPIDQLVQAGVTVPRLFGSLRNTFEWKGIQLGALISFKAGHVFRRNSIGPGQEYLGNPVYHMDYFKRWQQPGDERYTDVPAWAETAAPNQRWAMYEQSEALITKGGVIRLQDVSLSYTLPKAHIAATHLQSLRLYAYVRNLGILWRANEYGIDPDFPNADYPAPRSFALGIQLDF